MKRMWAEKDLLQGEGGFEERMWAEEKTVPREKMCPWGDGGGENIS